MDKRKIDNKTWKCKVTNAIKRNKIKKTCCICGRDNGRILHNTEDNPYYINFICRECSKDIKNLVYADEHRYNIEPYLKNSSFNKKYIQDKTYITKIVVDYMNTDETEQNYCKRIGLSWYHFKQCIDEYDKCYPTQNIKELINHKIGRYRSKIRRGEV